MEHLSILKLIIIECDFVSCVSNKLNNYLRHFLNKSMKLLKHSKYTNIIFKDTFIQ